jgi:transcriptional regulator with XRE-family HTH domain
MAKEKRAAQETRGEGLRRLRKAKGLSLEQVHQRTKIHIRILRALEEDAVAEIAPAYVKGLLKIYCAFLGVQPKDFIEEYTKGEPLKKESVDASEIEEHLHLAESRINISLIKKYLKIKPLIFVICLLALGILAFKFGESISIYRTSHSKKSPAMTIIPKPDVSSSAPVISKPRLDIRAKEKCWLEVRVDGKTIFRDVLKKGDFEYWEAEEEIEFSLGNAGAVDIEVNGKLLSPLGRRRQVIKKIKITKEGLTVPN